MRTGYTLDNDETVIREVNRHWIDLAPVVISAASLIIVSVALAYSYGRFKEVLAFIPVGLIYLLIVILIVLAAAIVVVGLFVYRQNKLVITDKHLILVIQAGLFSRTVSQLSLTKVQDVKAHRSGVMATILNYGSIEVETAGEEENFTFNLAPHPQGLADQCLSLHDKRPEALPAQENSEL